VRHQKQGLILDGLGVPLARLQMHWTTEQQKAKPDPDSLGARAGARLRGAAAWYIPKPAKEGSHKPAPTSALR